MKSRPFPTHLEASPKFPLLLSLLIGLLILPISARTWTDAEGQRSFEGELKAYEPTTGELTILRSDGKALTFHQSRLSGEDIAFLKEKGAVSPEGGSSKVPLGVVPDDPSDLPDPDGKEADMNQPVKVFILMGQSNMLGFGKVAGNKPGSLESATKEGKYPFLVDDAGDWTTRKDVRNVRVMNLKLHKNDWLTAASTGKIGPELGIGYYLGERFEAPVLILKSCIGNRSLGWDLLPPGSKAYKHDGKLQPGYGETPETAGSGEKYEGDKWYAGKQWDSDIAGVRQVLGKIGDYYPGATEYEVAGFAFWQGDKDRYNAAHAAHYEQNLVRLIKALREEFKAPQAPFVCATLGQTEKGADGNDGKILKAQLAVDGEAGNYPEFEGNVATVYSHPHSMGGASNGHYGGNAETYMNIGLAMGRALVELFPEN